MFKFIISIYYVEINLLHCIIIKAIFAVQQRDKDVETSEIKHKVNGPAECLKKFPQEGRLLVSQSHSLFLICFYNATHPC